MSPRETDQRDRNVPPAGNETVSSLYNVSRAVCKSCPRRCVIPADGTGFCRARGCRDEHGTSTVFDANYGRVTSLALDPIEKKPIARWRPGSLVVSVGSYGCNLRCPWCQNHEIAQCGAAQVPWREVTPAQLVSLALDVQREHPATCGIAWTYNEPLCGWEYVCDGERLAHEAGLATVLVTNGCFEPAVIDAVAPLTDAVNVDLKCFSEDGYRSLGGELTTVKASIERFSEEPGCHVEVTTLVVPGFNDSDDEMGALAAWLASVDPDLTLHVTRFFPAWKKRDTGPTLPRDVRRLADVARRHLRHVLVGNL